MGDMDADGVNDRWPLFLDNYFVPRGYAVILGQMNGTGYTSDGCPMHGGPGDIAGEKSIIDWLNGRVAGRSTGPATPVGRRRLAQRQVGDDRQVLRRHAVQRRRGDGRRRPEDDRPESRRSRDWYDYSRTTASATTPTTRRASTRRSRCDGTHPPGVNLPDRRTLCNAAVNTDFNDANVDTGDGDAGDINTFWERPRLRQGRRQRQGRRLRHARLPGRQRDAWTSCGRGGTGSRPTACRASCGCCASGHTDPFDVAPRRLGRHPAPLVRPLAVRRQQRDR